MSPNSHRCRKLVSAILILLLLFVNLTIITYIRQFNYYLNPMPYMATFCPEVESHYAGNLTEYKRMATLEHSMSLNMTLEQQRQTMTKVYYCYCKREN